jgi:hypothetical protein
MLFFSRTTMHMAMTTRLLDIEDKVEELYQIITMKERWTTEQHG